MSQDWTKAPRRIVLAGLLAGGASAAVANAPLTSLRPAPRPGSPSNGGTLSRHRPRRRPRPPDTDTLIADARLGANARIGFMVQDSRSGAIVDMLAPDLALPPASVNKAITALYALSELGVDYRFRTRVLANGPMSDGILKGDLILAGAGDPTLDTDALFALAAQLKAAGLREVRGRFLVWAGALPTVDRIDPSQPDHVGYNPAVGGLNLNFNRVHFEWRRAGSGWSTSMDARSERHRPAVGMAQMTIEDRDTPVYSYVQGANVDRWTVARGALGNGGSRWLPVRQPALYCGEVFASFARSHGLVLSRPMHTETLPGGVVLAEHSSQSARDILRGMLRFSTNITAEAMGLAASVKRGPSPTDLTTSAAQMTDWLRQSIQTQAPRLVDHSGLGDQSRISARDMVTALIRLGPEADLQGILKPIAMRGKDGKRADGHPATVRAKTGTLNFVSALAGYVELPSGRQLAFATFTADTDRRAGIARQDREAPAGAKAWARRSRLLQLRLIDRWSKLPLN